MLQKAFLGDCGIDFLQQFGVPHGWPLQLVSRDTPQLLCYWVQRNPRIVAEFAKICRVVWNLTGANPSARILECGGLFTLSFEGPPLLRRKQQLESDFLRRM
jgi:hypothetical protein